MTPRSHVPARRHLPALVGALLAAAALSGAAYASVGSVQSQLSATQGRAQSLSGSVARLSRLIAGLSASIAVVERRVASVQAQLAQDRAALAAVSAQLAHERIVADAMQRRYDVTRRALAQQLLTSYESDSPDAATVVFDANGLADLLDRLEFLRFTKQREQVVITATAAARAAAQGEAARLAPLQARDSQITSGVAAQASALTSMDDLLASRRAALQAAHDAQAQALHSARARGARLQKLLNKLEAQQYGAARAFGNWAIPAAIVMCESGGQNLPPNSAGASGYYQFMPATWQGLGGSTPNAYQAPKAEQDRLAAKLWDGGRGASNWVCAGIVGIH